PEERQAAEVRTTGRRRDFSARRALRSRRPGKRGGKRAMALTQTRASKLDQPPTQRPCRSVAPEQERLEVRAAEPEQSRRLLRTHTRRPHAAVEQRELAKHFARAEGGEQGLAGS